MTATMGDSIQRYPLLRLFISYLCGIGLADVLYPHTTLLSVIGLCGIALLLLLLVVCAGRRALAYGMVASMLFLMLGVCNYARARESARHEWVPSKAVYEASVVSEPRMRERSLLCEMEVHAVSDSAGWHKIEHQIFAYMEPSDEALSLLPGAMLQGEGACTS